MLKSPVNTVSLLSDDTCEEVDDKELMTKNHTIIRITSVLSIRIRKLNQLNQFMYEGNTSRKELGWIQKQQAARCKK